MPDIRVDCVPGGGSGEQVCYFHFHLVIAMYYNVIASQDGGVGAIVPNMEDREEIPKAVVRPR